MRSIKLLILFLLTLGQIVMAADELILNTESTFNPSHTNRFGVSIGANPSVTKASDIINFNFSYSKKMETFWLDSNLFITNGVFQKLTGNNTSATGADLSTLEGTKSTLTTLGLGVAHESRYSQYLFPFDNLYEITTANLTYNLFKESTQNKSFSGPGMIAKFALYKKFSDYFSLGGQFTYNLAIVKRQQDYDTEASSLRSLTMSQLTVGLDFSFFL